MKRLIFFALASIVSLQAASAQQKGEKYIGGYLGISTSSTSISSLPSTTSTVFGIAPEFGGFVTDRLRLSGAIAYELVSESDPTHALTIGPSVAYYVRLCDKFYYTPEVGIGFAYTSTSDLKGYGFTTRLALVAAELRPSARLGISFSLLALDYTQLSFPDMDISGSSVQFNLGISPTIGFKYYF